MDAGVSCVGFDSSTQQEAPRSIADFLEAHIANLENLRRSAVLQQAAQCRSSITTANTTLPSPAESQDTDTNAISSPWRSEKCAFADSLVNQVMHDLTPSFLGVTKATPLLQCVVRGTQLPSKKGPVLSNDLDENHPRSILNPQSAKGLFHDLMPDEDGANTLLQNYLDRVITQYPIYHKNDVTSAFNSIYHKRAAIASDDSARSRYIVCIVMAISLSTIARSKVQKANETAFQLVRHAMQWIPDVATNDIPGLQAVLLLTQYIFLNPKMADLWLLTGLISQAVIDLGLHQELPDDKRVTPFDRDMRRRLFWCAWEMEVGVCCIFLRPTSLPIRNIEVAFPLEIDDTAITQASIDPTGRVSKFTQRIICRFRMIEAEIIAVLWHGDALPPEFDSLEGWMQHCIRSMAEWQQDIYAAAAANQDRTLVARWKEMCLYTDIAVPYVLVALYRSSLRIPNPTKDQMMIAMFNAVKVAEGYYQQAEAEAGKIKYVFQPCHHVFNCALVFLQGLQRHKDEVAALYSWQQVEEWMQVFVTCFTSISERWTAARRCLDEYERLLVPVRKEYLDFLNQKNGSQLHSTFRSEISMVAGISHPTPITAPTEVDEAYRFWNVFNPTSTTDASDVRGALALQPMIGDWTSEFHLSQG